MFDVPVKPFITPANNNDKGFAIDKPKAIAAFAFVELSSLCRLSLKSVKNYLKLTPKSLINLRSLKFFILLI